MLVAGILLYCTCSSYHISPVVKAFIPSTCIFTHFQLPCLPHIKKLNSQWISKKFSYLNYINIVLEETRAVFVPSDHINSSGSEMFRIWVRHERKSQRISVTKDSKIDWITSTLLLLEEIIPTVRNYGLLASINRLLYSAKDYSWW